MLKEYFSGSIYEYECNFIISYQPDTVMNLSDYGIEILNNRPLKEFSDEEIKFYDQDAGASIVMITVKSPDEYTARCKAEEKLESFFAVSRLYQDRITKIKHPLVLTRNLDTDKYQCIREDITGLQYIKDARKPNDNIAVLIRLLNGLKAKDTGQLNASLQHHKLALAASTDDARLVNLWIALESLVKTGSRNIIERLSKYVSATNTTNYTYRMLRALTIDMRSLWKSSDTTTLRIVLRSSNRYFLHMQDLLSILIDRKDGPLITTFLSFTSANTLLTFRVFRLWENIFNSPSRLSNHLKKHKQNVEWQIRRIYRARNQIIHQGACFAGTRQLIQHLQTYYTITINNRG